MKPRLSFALKDNDKGLPLDVLLDRALATLTLDGRVDPRQRPWLAKCALRAVCEAILRDNCATFPLEIEVLSQHRMAEPAYFERERRKAENIIPVKFDEHSAA